MADLRIQDHGDIYSRTTEDDIHRAVTHSTGSASSPQNEVFPEDDFSHPLYPSTFDNLLAGTQDTFDSDLLQHLPDLTTFADDAFQDYPALSSWRGYEDPMDLLFARMDEELQKELRGEINQDMPDFIRPGNLARFSQVQSSFMTRFPWEIRRQIYAFALTSNPTFKDINSQSSRVENINSEASITLLLTCTRINHEVRPLLYGLNSITLPEVFGRDFEDAGEDWTEPDQRFVDYGEHRLYQRQTRPKKDKSRKRKASSQGETEKQRRTKKDSGVWIDLSDSDKDIPHDDAPQEEWSTPFNIPAPNPRGYVTHSDLWIDLFGSDEGIQHDDVPHEEKSTSHGTSALNPHGYVTELMDEDSEEGGITLAEVNAAGIRAGLSPMDFDEWSEDM